MHYNADFVLKAGNSEQETALLKWDVVGEVLITGVLKADDIASTDGCAQAAALADKF